MGLMLRSPVRRHTQTRAQAQQSIESSNTKSYLHCATCLTPLTKRHPGMLTRRQDDEQALTADGEPDNLDARGNALLGDGSLFARQGTTIQNQKHANENH